MSPDTKLGTRAALAAATRRESCGGCEDRIAARDIVVFCNVYAHGKWDHLEIFHTDCYESAGKPHGEVGAYADKFTLGVAKIHKVRKCWRCQREFLCPPTRGRVSCDTCRRGKRSRGAA